MQLCTPAAVAYVVKEEIRGARPIKCGRPFAQSRWECSLKALLFEESVEAARNCPDGRIVVGFSSWNF